MHVLFLGGRGHISPDRRGAIEKLTVDLASALTDAGHEATILTVGDERRRYTAEGVRFVEMFDVIEKPPSYVLPVARFGRRATAVARRIHRNRPIDVVHAEYYPNLLGFRAPGDVPVVVTEHNPHPWRKEFAYLSDLTVPHRLRWEADTYLRRFEAHVTFRRADRVLSVSDAHGEWIDGVIPEARAKRETMYNYVDTDRYHPDADAAVDADIDLQSPSLLYAGRKVPHKGLHRAVEALAHMSVDAELVVLGPLGSGFDSADAADSLDAIDDPYLRSIIEDAERAGVVSQLHFPGYVPDAHLPAYYAAADAVVFPSVLESFGLVPIEGNACGTPAVAHDVPPLTETIVDGETGVLTPPDARRFGDALDELLTDEDRLEAIGKAARERAVERFSIPTARRAHLDLYRTVSG